MRFQVLHPLTDWHPETSDNARSLVLDVAFASRHLVLTGDLEQQGLLELVARPSPEPPPGCLLISPPRGQVGQPRMALQVGKTPTGCRQPAPLPSRTSDALAPLERQGTPLLRTCARRVDPLPVDRGRNHGKSFSLS